MSIMNLPAPALTFWQNIKHVWIPVFPLTSTDPFKTISVPVYSATFTDKQLPGVSFQLFAIVTRFDQFTIHLTKTPCDSAYAEFKVTVHGTIVRLGSAKNWNNDRISYDITIPNSIIPLYGKLIEFEIRWHGFLSKADNITRIGAPVPSYSSNLYDYTTHLLKSPDLSDIVIMIKGKEFPVHKIILACQSSVFMAMFRSIKSELPNNRIDVQDIDVEIMEKMIEFLYTGRFDSKSLEFDGILTILAVAHKYNIVGMKNFCENDLMTKISKTNVLRIFEKAHEYKLVTLIKKSMKLMINDREEISTTEDFKNLYDRKPEILFTYITCIMKK